MRNRLKSREMVIQEEKEREKTLETMYEVDLLIDSALRRAEDGKLFGLGTTLVRIEIGLGCFWVLGCPGSVRSWSRFYGLQTWSMRVRG